MLFVSIPQQTDVSFQEFWKSYPLHKARRDAEKAWRQVKASEHLTEILEAIALQKQEKAELQAKRQFCPNWPLGATWLRGARWEDEVALSGRLTLADAPCPVCGHPNPRWHSRVECNQRLLARARAASVPGPTTDTPQ